MGEDPARLRVSCRDCSFEQVVDACGDTKPADVLVEHGQQTGHTLSVSKVGE
ncbi:hypothetical protein NGM10_00385 [Halorussus salilacus]|uniref:hypothetical protein n=1 Tax=Halorussus salilacus TaxID=2953750 RepID=UPI00209D0263|nr:hypothetical protein [Halorussus salilacus]USZ68216.1 hypothetical protein NGM10_00385 [Halorussus salilacus]